MSTITPAPYLPGVGRAERLTPLAHSLVTDHDSASGQQRGNVAQAQIEPVPQPDDLAEGVRGEDDSVARLAEVDVSSRVSAKMLFHRCLQPSDLCVESGDDAYHRAIVVRM